MGTQTDPKIQALSDFHETNADDIEPSSYDDNTYEVDGCEYLVLTDEEADEAVVDYIKQSVWAFNASFLSDFTGLPEAMFAGIQEQCEGANDAILQVIEQGDGISSFAEQAVSYDGRGHFLSGYDGNEVEQGDFFIYRMN